MDIFFTLQDSLNIKIDCNSRDYIKSCEDLMTKYKSGFQYMKAYKSGGWDGKISLFNRPKRSFPYGLMIDVIKMTKKDFPDLEYGLSDDVKKMYKGLSRPYEWNLIHKPYDYQGDCIEALLGFSKGIVIVATAGGKSLIISYIIENAKQDHNLIIVPTLALVDQFKSDMIEYGIPEDDIGMVNSKKKELGKRIVVSTWQSLKNQMDSLKYFDVVIVDEVHTAQAKSIKEILQGCINCHYRIGVTGTLPTNDLDALTVRSYIGPVLRTYTGRDLADMGYISHCTINQIYIDYKDTYGGEYLDVRDDTFVNKYRIGLIKELVARVDHSILILVEKIEKEGVVLLEELEKTFPNRTVVFLSGKDKSDVRDKWRKDMNIQDDIVCIATYPIFQQGVNIPSLRTIVLASPTKSYIRVIQSLGRALRKHVSKEEGGAFLWDICDNVKFLKDHASKRNRHFIKEKHEVIEMTMKESDGVYTFNQDQ